ELLALERDCDAAEGLDRGVAAPVDLAETFGAGGGRARRARQIGGGRARVHRALLVGRRGPLEGSFAVNGTAGARICHPSSGSAEGSFSRRPRGRARSRPARARGGRGL